MSLYLLPIFIFANSIKIILAVHHIHQLHTSLFQIPLPDIIFLLRIYITLSL